MMMVVTLKYSLVLMTLLACVVIASAAGSTTQTIVYDGIPSEVSISAGATDDLWITTSDLTRVTRFTIKPQGVCRDELCFPLPRDRKAEFVSTRGNTTWFNLTEFARLIKQSFVTDQKNAVWYFGPLAAEQNRYLTSLEAPDFTLPDQNGKLHSLADFRGRKVLLVTWASW